jgi:hypothetical protein
MKALFTVNSNDSNGLEVVVQLGEFIVLAPIVHVLSKGTGDGRWRLSGQRRRCSSLQWASNRSYTLRNVRREVSLRDLRESVGQG